MAIHRNVRGGKPSPYPRIPFHALRSAQLLGALVVSGIMAYFIDHLKDEKYNIPWTFIVLLAVSLSTIIVLVVTIILYNFTYLSPRFNLILNGSISLGWALGLALLTWSIAGSEVLQKSCSQFGADAAVGVCREYKSLWSCTLCGTVATVLAVILDAVTMRRDGKGGAYRLPEDDREEQKLRDMKRANKVGEEYDLPEEQRRTATAWGNFERDYPTYDSTYGQQQPMGPPDSTSGDIGGAYRDRI